MMEPIAALDQPAPAADPGPRKRISKKVAAAIDAMVSGEARRLLMRPRRRSGWRAKA
jgi:hypothetical protein